MTTFQITSTFAEYKSYYKNFPSGQVWNQPGEVLSYEQAFSKVAAYLEQQGFVENNGVYGSELDGEFEYGDMMASCDGETIRIEAIN